MNSEGVDVVWVSHCPHVDGFGGGWGGQHVEEKSNLDVHPFFAWDNKGVNCPYNVCRVPSKFDKSEIYPFEVQFRLS